MCYGVQMSDDVAEIANHRLTELKNLVHSLDVQMGQLNADSVSDALRNDITVCTEALQTALTSMALDKARQDIAQAQKVIETATQFINQVKVDSL